ncbi:MAG: hypothetical protein QGI45_07745 [Myxococcota bacterium]|jgi:hypothetical protein|nr:hypothetical protein [Myxococcota bacterium]
MARTNLQLVDVLRTTAARLRSGARYEWGHMGRCNAGHVVQTITGQDAGAIVRSVDFALDEWSEHARGYCAGTGEKVEHLFLTMREVGLDHEDVMNLEYLCDKKVLARLPQEKRHLRHNQRDDVIVYLNAMADMLEEELKAS